MWQRDINFLLPLLLQGSTKIYSRSKFEEDLTGKVNPKKKYNKVNYNQKKADDDKDKDKDTFKFN